MQVPFVRFTHLVLAVLAGIVLAAPRSGFTEDADGFKLIFDGKTFHCWKAPDMAYWSIEDGAITAKITKFKLEDWHEYHLICQGPHLVLKVNGRLAAEVIDGDAHRRAPAGLLGLQLHSGPPMTVQFKDIRLKTLAAAPIVPVLSPPPAVKLPMIADKTLVAWVSPANLVQQGGSALTLDDEHGNFDGIVFAERTPGRWMAGSNGFTRTQMDQIEYPAETADAKTLVQMAIVYRGKEITMYRDGKRYARYDINEPQNFGPGSAVVMGLRHLTAGDGKCFAGTIDDARIYDFALSAEQLAALKPNQISEPKPLAWFNFEDGKASDLMGRFAEVELSRGARVADGRLCLDGQEGTLVALSGGVKQYVSPIHYRPRRGVFGDPIPFYWNGEYHVFYLRGGVDKVPWEHIVSKDLIHWQELPPALLPHGDPKGPDGFHMFTGSAVQGEGKFHIFYTGHNPANPDGLEFVRHATSADLIHWTKYPNETLAPDGVHYANKRQRDFRDPYVFWNEDAKEYWMLLCANSLQGGGAGLAVSKDLKTWKQVRALDAPNQECPDLFKIGDTWYLIGGGNYRYGKDARGPYKDPAFNNVIDRPFVYAGKRMFDGRRHIWVGWLWDRGGFSDSGTPGWGGTQCLPRELYPGPGGQLYCRPASEVTAVFTKTVLELSQKADLTALSVPDNYMLQCKIRMDPKTVVTLAMRKTDEPESGYRLILRPEKQEAEIAGKTFHEPRRIELDTSKPITIQAFVQGSMIETFINDQYAFSCRGYDYPAGKLSLSGVRGEMKVLELKVKVDAASAATSGAIIPAAALPTPGRLPPSTPAATTDTSVLCDKKLAACERRW